MLREAFRLLLSHRTAWNVQRLFWYHWRDPRRSQANCSFCASAGLVTSHQVMKPAHSAFTSFSAETTRPRAAITSGPHPGSLTGDPTPSFALSSSEAGSTFQCRFDTRRFSWCPPHFTARSPLSDGGHRLAVRAVDVAGNLSDPVWRSFRVDTHAPTVNISSGPANGSVTSNTKPSFSFTAKEPQVSLRCRLDSSEFVPCSSPHATGQLAGGQHRFAVIATDRAGNTGPPATRTWRVDSDAPTVRIISGPANGSAISDPRPEFRFASSEPRSRLECRLDSRGFVPCISPRRPGPLLDGSHTLAVRAIDGARNRGMPTRVRFTVDTAPPRLKIEGPLKVRTSQRAVAADFRLVTSERVGRWCRIASSRYRPCSPRYRTPKLGEGPHMVKVKVVDRAGNAAIRRKRFMVVREARTSPTAKPRDRERLSGISNGGVAAGG
jgi:hypothetical protein